MATCYQGTKSVYKDMRNGHWAAVKKIPGDCVDRNKMDAYYENYRYLDHPNIEKIVARPLRQWDHMWHIPMEWIFGEKLEKIMFYPRRSSIQPTPVITSRIITGMCEGLLYLHHNGIVHQDINPKNIMVDGESYRSVIIGVFNHEGLYAAKKQRNPQYTAPETCNSPSSDVWALGKVIFELLVGYQQSHSDINTDSIMNGLRGNVYQDPVLAMLESSPAHRASMERIIDHIRAAQYKAQATNSLSAPSTSIVRPLNAPQPYSGSGFGQDLLPDFPLPYPLPPNHTLTLNHCTYDDRGRKTETKGELRTRNGRIHDVWWTKIKPNDSDEDPWFLE